MGYYERNLELLRGRDPRLAAKVDAAKAIPVKEPDELPADFLAALGARGIVFLMGIGSGRTLSQIMRVLTPKQGLIVFEASFGVLKYAMTKRSMEKFFSFPQTMLFMEEISCDFMQTIHMRLTNEVCLQVEEKESTKLNPDAYKKVMERILEEKSFYDVNLGTCISLGRHFANSILENIPAIMRARGVGALCGLFQGAPAIVCSSGPSLDLELETLKRAKGKAVIISIDTALPHLLSHGVVPDLICGIDPLPDNKVLFKRHRNLLKSIPAVLLAQYTPAVMASYPGPLFVGAMPGNQFYAWLMGYWEEKGNVDCFGGSVSHFGFAIADFLGCDTIALVGQDLCYKKNYHAGAITKLLHDGMGLEEPDETKLGYPTKNRLGEEVLTKVHLQSFRMAFESRIKNSPHLKAFNTTVEGLEIAGATFIPLAEYVEEYGVEVDTKAAFEYIQQREPRYLKEELEQSLDNVISIFRLVSRTSLRILKLIHKIEALRKTGNKDEIRRLVRKVEALRPITRHPLTALLSSYYHHMEVYINKSEIKDIDEIRHKWKRLDAQLNRGLNFYGELREGVQILTKQLLKLRAGLLERQEDTDAKQAAAN